MFVYPKFHEWLGSNSFFFCDTARKTKSMRTYMYVRRCHFFTPDLMGLVPMRFLVTVVTSWSIGSNKDKETYSCELDMGPLPQANEGT
jgi:hypothetical protein